MGQRADAIAMLNERVKRGLSMPVPEYSTLITTSTISCVASRRRGLLVCWAQDEARVLLAKLHHVLQAVLEAPPTAAPARAPQLAGVIGEYAAAAAQYRSLPGVSAAVLSAAKALLKARRPAHEIAGLAAAAVGIAEHRIVAALLPLSSPSPSPFPSAVRERTRERTRTRFDELAAEHAVVGEASMHVPAAPNAELERVRCALRHLDTALRVGARSSSAHTSGAATAPDAQGGGWRGHIRGGAGRRSG